MDGIMGPVKPLGMGILLIYFLAAEAFAFTSFTTSAAARTHALAAATVDARGGRSSSSRSALNAPGTPPALRRWTTMAAVQSSPHGAVRRSTRSARNTTGQRSARGINNGDEDEPYIIPGSGLRGVDTSKLRGSDKRDAEWFKRTSEREASGQLQWFEDPVTYIALFALVPVLIGVWGVLNCYIPGFCSPN